MELLGSFPKLLKFSVEFLTIQQFNSLGNTLSIKVKRELKQIKK